MSENNLKMTANPYAAPNFYVSANNLTPTYGDGIDIITGTKYTSIFSRFPDPQADGSKSTTSNSSVSTITSSSDYQRSCNAEASLAGKYTTTSISAKGSVSSSLALNTQSLGVVANGSIIGQTFQPNFKDAEIDRDIDLNSFKSYSDFVTRHGSHFIGGYITGASYSAAYQMDCSSYSDAQNLSASLKASTSDFAFSANFSSSVQKAVTNSGTQCNTSWHQTAIGWPDSAPRLEEATSTGISDNMTHFLQLKSSDLTLPVAYICYDWRMIPAIQKCAWAQTPDVDMQQMGLNQPTVASAYQQLQYAQTSANNSISSDPPSIRGGFS